MVGFDVDLIPGLVVALMIPPTTGVLRGLRVAVAFGLELGRIVAGANVGEATETLPAAAAVGATVRAGDDSGAGAVSSVALGSEFLKTFCETVKLAGAELGGLTFLVY